MLFDIPLFIIISFLLCTAGIVFYSIKSFTTFLVYAVGNRQFSTASLIATTLATYYGGAVFIDSLHVSSSGPFLISWVLFISLFPFLTLSWLSGRMSKFIYHISMPETMGRVYGKYPRVITAVLSICSSTALVAMQIHILSQVISRCIHSVNPVFITILATMLLVAYTIFGGSRAVVLTDVWQSITFVSLICLLAWFMFTKTGCTISETFALVTTQKQFVSGLPLFGQKKLIYTLRYLSLVCTFIEPGYMQHIYMAAAPSQAKKVCLYAGIISFFIMLCFILTGAFVSTWLPPDVPPQKTLHYLLMHIPPLFKGVLCICLLALTMSTADSRLHICAVMISNDLLPVLFPARFRKNISCTDHYRIAYISILFIATLAIIVSLNSLYFSIVRGMVNRLHAFYMPIVVAPFILAVLGLRTSSYTVLIGMVAGTLAVFGWRKWMYPLLLTDRSTFPCILTNGLVMLAVHYVGPQPKHIKNLGSLLATLAKKIKPAFIRRYPLR